jgi:hypothetical protein
MAETMIKAYSAIYFWYPVKYDLYQIRCDYPAYLGKHQARIVNYGAYQAEQLCSIGSGAVESAVKQIGRRLQISEALWNTASANPMLSLRCAYLNGQLAC